MGRQNGGAGSSTCMLRVLKVKGQWWGTWSLDVMGSSDKMDLEVVIKWKVRGKMAQQVGKGWR